MGNLLDSSAYANGVGMVLADIGSGSGVSIGGNWILTAAHVIRTSGGTVSSPANVTFRLGSIGTGTNYTVDQIVPHATDDIALIHVTTALPGFFNMNFNVVADQTQFDIVGYGLTGSLSGQTWTVDQNSYGTRRRGQNVVSNSNFDFGQTTGFNRWHVMYRYDFDGNNVDSFGDAGPVTGGDAVGLSGDSGGGLFANGSLFALHNGRQGGFGGANLDQWGTVGVGIRLSDYRGFINGTVPEPMTIAALGLGTLALLRRKRR